LPVLEDHHALTTLEFEIDGRIVACGDVMLTGHGPGGKTLRVGVELKKMSDALTSISTGRLGGTQIPRMLRVYDVVFILTYGQYRVGAHNYLEVRRRDGWQQYRIGTRAVPWSYFEGFLLSAQIQASLLSKPLFHKHVYDINEAAHWLRVLDSWLEKPWDKHRARAVFDKSREMSALPNADPVETQIARTAASLPAFDWVRGHAIAKHFDSIEEMMGASIKRWQEIKGVGPVLAKAAYTAIRRRKK
jgi:ERCC4-type nuclease